jgi:hypothetical protein
MQSWADKTAAYWDKASQFVRNGTTDPRNPPWFGIELGDHATSLWADYFLWRLGGLPAGMKYLGQHKLKSFLVPCERPEWFDIEYVPPHSVELWPPADPVATPESKRRVGEMAASMPLMQDVDRDRRRREASVRAQERNAQAFERECAAAGIDPAGGVSPSLRKQLQGA